MTVTLHQLYAAFEVDDREPVRRLARRAETDCRLGVTVLSAAAREGFPLGTGSTELLDRHRRKTDTYAQLVRAVIEALPDPRTVWVQKGPELARLYPEDLVRPAGDLDLVADDETSFWVAARTTVSRHGAVPAQLTCFRSADRTDFVMGLEWASPDPLVEPDYEVELSTIAFTGDGVSLPLRYSRPEPEPLAQLLALAEEMFQRPPSVKDALDVLALLPSMRGLDERHLVDVLGAYRLGPELETLLLAAAAVFPAAVVDPGALDAVAGAAERERAGRPAPPADATDVAAWPGNIAFGVHLGEGGFDHSAGARFAVCADTASEVLCTPVGDFLLVRGAEVDQVVWDDAIDRLPELHRTGPGVVAR